MLGAAGLIRAYSTATKQAINEAEKVKMFLCDEVEICLKYNYYGNLNHILSTFAHKIINGEFNEQIKTTVVIKSSDYEQFNKKIIELTNNNVKLKITNKYFFEI